MTTPYFFVEEHQIINALFDEGLEILHLRKPETEPVYSERLLTLIDESYRKRIVVHDHFYLKNEYNLKGIHLNQRNPELPPKYKGHLSCSCRTEQEVTQHKKACDYVFLSPLFDTSTGMAFGGGGLNNVSSLKDYGFGGVVILGDIWNRFSIHSTQDFKDLIQHFRKLRKAVE